MASKKKDAGYKKPPQNTRFEKGRSGNPKGRPKGTKNLKTDLEEELQEEILVREGNREKQMSKQRAMVKSLLASTMKGDSRAADQILKMIFRLLEVHTPEEDEDLGPDERVILANYDAEVLRRAQRKACPPPAAKAAPKEGPQPEGVRLAEAKPSDTPETRDLLLKQALDTILGKRPGGSSHAR